ncbi:MAG: hypothetical protein WC745_00760 [Patescibacteria group bacterium]|jgi:hypothetical protein
MQNQNASAGIRKFGNVSWRYYNLLKKKAMDKESGMTGLLISLSIAFFIVVGGAEGLNLSFKMYTDVDKPAKTTEEAPGERKMINRYENVFQYVARFREFSGTKNS